LHRKKINNFLRSFSQQIDYIKKAKEIRSLKSEKTAWGQIINFTRILPKGNLIQHLTTLLI